VKQGTEKAFCWEHDKPMICGKPRNACQECTQKGLNYHNGYGGPSYIINTITNENFWTDKLPQKPYINNFFIKK